MRRLIACAAVVAPFVWVFAVAANEKPTADFQAAMKSNGATNGALRMHVMAKDYDAIVKDADTLKANYAKVEPFWAAKKADDAIALAKKGAMAAADLETAARAKNDEQIGAAAMALGSTCQGCHMAHREQLPDKTFEIK
jgi:cytochrome c556